VVWALKPSDGAPASAGSGTMIALPAAARAEVDVFHAAGVATAGADEEPGTEPCGGEPARDFRSGQGTERRRCSAEPSKRRAEHRQR